MHVFSEFDEKAQTKPLIKASFQQELVILDFPDFSRVLQNNQFSICVLYVGVQCGVGKILKIGPMNMEGRSQR